MKTNLLRRLFLLFLGMIGLAWSMPRPPAAVWPRLTIGAEWQTIRDWVVIGPFEEPRSSAAPVDFLATLGLSEKMGQVGEVRRVIEGAISRSGTAFVRRYTGSERLDLAQFFERVPSEQTSPITAYLTCEFFAEQAREICLMLGNTGFVKVWLNGVEFLSRDAQGNNFEKYTDSVSLPLRAGSNLFLMKVRMVDGPWVVNAKLKSDEASASMEIIAGSRFVLKYAFVPQGQALELEPTALPSGVRLLAKILNSHGDVVRSLQMGANCPGDLTGLAEGVYEICWSLNGQELRRTSVVLGSARRLQAELAARSLPFQGEESVAINLQTLLRRAEILGRGGFDSKEQPPTARLATRQTEVNLAYTLSGLAKALDRLENRQEPFRGQPGLHLRGFRSRIDDQVFHYRLSVPVGYESGAGSLPLIIVMPTVFSASRSFLESIYLANLSESEDMAKVLESHGVGILWPGYRNCPYGNPIDQAYLDEVLQAVAKDYRLDLHRLSLLGNCSGGLGAAMETARNPTRYAGLALLNPVLRRLKNRYDDNPDFFQQGTYREWLRTTDPVEKLARNLTVPMQIVHDGLDADHGPLAHSVELVEHARSLGREVEFVRKPGLKDGRIARSLLWLAAQRRETAGPLIFPEAPAGGPISRVFAERFIVVRGTLGSAPEQAAATAWCEAFVAAWQRVN